MLDKLKYLFAYISMIIVVFVGPYSSAHAQSVRCLHDQKLISFLRDATLIGRGISTGKIWKGYFPQGKKAIYRYNDGSTKTANWRASGNKVCMSFDGLNFVCRHICILNRKVLWLDQKTRKPSSEIIKRLKGNHTGVARVVSRPNHRRNIRRKNKKPSQNSWVSSKKKTSKKIRNREPKKSEDAGISWDDVKKMK